MHDPRRTRQQGTFLVAAVVVAVLAVACGRASEAEINQALGITPTATASAEQLATGTAAAAATSDARTAVAAAPAISPKAGESPAAAAAAAVAGDVTRGRVQFLTNCQGCHGPAGNGGNLLAAGGAGATMAFESVLPLIREGTGHPVPPGPYPATRLSDSNIRDLVAFVRAQAGG